MNDKWDILTQTLLSNTMVTTNTVKGVKADASQYVYDGALPHLENVQFGNTNDDRRVPAKEAAFCDTFATYIDNNLVRSRKENKDSAYLFNGKYWERRELADLADVCQRLLEAINVGIVYQQNSSEAIAKEVIRKRYYTGGKFSPDNRLIAYPNGILNINTGELLDFDPKWQTNYVISDYDFNSTADCPMFCAMLESALPDELDRLVLQECFGYLFFPDKRHEVVTLLVGKGQDGKSTVIDAVSSALGKNNITSYSLTHITDERGYAIAGMVGKLGNICFESGSLRIGNEALYKSYASGEPMFARQLYKDGYLTTDYPASVVAVNNLPATLDHSEGFYRRAQIITFENSIPSDKVDPMFKTKLQQERAGIMNWVLTGYRRLLQQGHFTAAPNITKAKERYRIETDSVASFIDEQGYVPSEVEKQPLNELYKTFAEWAKSFGYQPSHVRNLSTRLRSLGFTVKKIGGTTQVFIAQILKADDDYPF